MNNTPTILAIIPARGGSKGLPKKNILNLKGKPLIAWSIEAAKNSKYINRIIVSSDNEEILNISKQYDVDTLKRPHQFATDTASSESVVLHTIESLKEKYDYIMLLQPTSPFRDTQTINKALEIFFNNDADALISVSQTDNKILKAFLETEDGYIKGVSNNQYPFMPRQKLPSVYMSNGAIYIIKTELLKKTKSFFTQKTIPYEMDEISSFDIDTQEDFKKAESLLSI